MDHLANYIVTHLKWSSTPGQLAECRLLERAGGQFEDRGLTERGDIIDLLAADERIFAWDYDADDIGDEFDLVTVEGAPYVRTDGERLRADHAGGLPEV